MRAFATLLITIFSIAGVVACSDYDPREMPEGSESSKSFDMDADSVEILARKDVSSGTVEVEHILIAFKGSERSEATRSKEEAEELAKEIYGKIKNGEDFDALKTKYTDDGGQKDADGTYVMFDSSKGGKKVGTSMNRANMAPGFGDVSWRLKVDEVGVSPHKEGYSNFGWHIIKRVK